MKHDMQANGSAIVQQADGSAERLLSPTIVAPMLVFGETLPLHH